MLIPMLPSLFRTPRPRPFRYMPRYAKEKEEEGKSIRFSPQRRNRSSPREPGAGSNLRLIIIIIAMALFAWYIIVF